MPTKQQLAAMPQPTVYSGPDIPIKVRRSLARRAAEPRYRKGVRPIYFAYETTLSHMYDNSSDELYLNQLFTDIDKIGQGCFGDVYKARSKEDNKMYAIKVTNDTHSFIDLGEVRRLEKIPCHRNCIRYYQAWQESYRLYIKMELCMTSLDKLLLVNHNITEPQCWEILTDVCEGLKHLHDNSLIHMDLKPANIMLSTNGVCKLGDFGLLVDLREVNSETMKRKRTGMSVSEGDGKYVAVEVLQGGIYTTAGDIFSLGMMMVEIASDAALPSSGSKWDDIRNGIMPQCYYERKLSTNFRHLIGEMVVRNHTQRPSVDDILNNKVIEAIFIERGKAQGVNHFADWQEQWQNHVAAHANNNVPLDIPVVQVEGPSPPRRPYPINYVSPLDHEALREPSSVELSLRLPGPQNLAENREASQSSPSGRLGRNGRGRNTPRRLFI